MPTIRFREHDVEITTDVGGMSLDDAEILESELGLDLRDVMRLPKVKLFKTLALISVRRQFSDATMAEVGKLSLMELARAFGGAASTAAAAAVEGVAAELVEQSDEGEVLSPTNAASDEGSTPAV